MAADNKYDMVACGHIHQPLIKDFEIDNKKIEYMNSGDWIENLVGCYTYPTPGATNNSCLTPVGGCTDPAYSNYR